MGKRKLFIGIIVGAIAGGLTSLFDQETRDYTKDKLGQVKEKSGQIVRNPSQAVRDVRFTFDRMNNNVTENIQKAINTLEQVEDSLDKVTNRNKLNS